jgi:hypothetical protein
LPASEINQNRFKRSPLRLRLNFVTDEANPSDQLSGDFLPKSHESIPILLNPAANPYASQSQQLERYIHTSIARRVRVPSLIETRSSAKKPPAKFQDANSRKNKENEL